MTDTLSTIYKKLKFNKDNGLYDLSEIDECKNLALRYKNALKIIKPNSFFCFEDEPFILFFDLSNEDNEDRLKKIQEQVWNFDKAPIAIVITKTDIIFYNAFSTKNDVLELNTFLREKIQDIDENTQIYDFSFDNIYSGNFLNQYKEAFNDKTRVNRALFEHIKNYHKKLKDENLKSITAINLLTRIIFLRYLNDRNVEIKNNNFNIETIFSNTKTLYSFFNELKKKFNGDLFDVPQNEISTVTTNHLNTLLSFWKDAGIYGQLRLFPYDFSIIPIELISNIYEEFLIENQGKNKSYYTPAFLVDYIIKNTVSIFLDKRKDNSCKVLDPACGSGIFLIESLRKIISKEEELNNNKKLTSTSLNKIVKNNIFGIDKDAGAINIAIFSLYITLLDYQDPKSILNYKLPSLKNSNFFVSDFFDTKHEFNTILKNKGIDFILSNPPYGSIKKDKHIKYYQSENIPINDYQIAQSFLYRAKDFSTLTTKCSMIVISKVLYNLNAHDFRKKFLSNFNIEKVVELSAVRKQLFLNADTPTSIIFYNYSNLQPTEDNIIEHISVKPNIYFKLLKILVFEKNDYKQIEQSYLIKNDWLWRVLLYGNILDFYFIKRLFDSFEKIGDKKSDFIYGEGIQFGGGAKMTSKHLVGLPYLDTKKKMLKRFSADLKNSVKFQEVLLYRNKINDKEIFEAPHLLIKKGNAVDFSCVSAVSNEDCVFTDSIYSIKIKDNSTDNLYNLCGILNSEFFNYFIFNTGVSSAVERNQIHFNEYFNTPYSYSEDVSNASKQLHLNQDNNESKNRHKLEQKLNQSVFELFSINDCEQDLIDYALNISIPIWKYGENILKNKIPQALKPVSENNLKEYAEIFNKFFKEKYEGFNIEIFNSENYTLMNFKIELNKNLNDSISFNKTHNIVSDLKQLTNLSISQLSKKMFIQRDIKGFQENSFYVLKTNEYKNWHKAIARRDVNEFAHAIMEAEIESIKS